MKAAVVTGPGKTPIYGEFAEPTAKAGEELVTVRAAALSQLTKVRASGAHYSAAGVFPAVAGSDGVGLTGDGRRVYFALPEAPFGTLAERCPIAARRCVAIPDGVDDVTAAAIANPGMSAWGALMERAHLVAGETVMVNGATGTAGRVAVQLAKYLGAARVIGTGRNAADLEDLKRIGAATVIQFSLDGENQTGVKQYEDALGEVFSGGIDVVIDYLWGESAKATIGALARTIGERPVRFVQVGTASGEPNISLAGAALRSSAITLMGSGIGSVSREALLRSIRNVFEAVEPAGLKVATELVPLADVEAAWDRPSGRRRVVFTME